MAFPTTAWYCSSAGYTAVTARPQNTAVAAGVLRKQAVAPAVGSERVFVCIVAGTTANTADATWTTTRGAKTTDSGATWQECTGVAAVNGDVANTVNWNSVKNTAVTLGAIIKNVAATHYFIASTAGTAGNGAEPSWGTTAGNTTADGASLIWTCIGAVGSFGAWAAPHARMQAVGALSIQVRESCYLADNHAETQAASMTITMPGAVGTPNYIFTVDHTASFPLTASNITTGSSITTTATNSMTINGSFYWYGTTFNCTSGGSSGGSFQIAGNGSADEYFDACALNFLETASSGSAIVFGTSNSGRAHKITLNNTPIQINNTGSGIAVNNVSLIWQNTASAVGGSTFPTSFFGAGAGAAGSEIVIRGCDLSALGSGKTLFAGAGMTSYVRAYVIDCKLDASVTIGVPTHQAARFYVLRSASGAGITRTDEYAYEGTLTTELTIVRTGGASDGSTSYARKVVTTANCSFQFPFDSRPIEIWNETAGSPVTVTVYGVWGSGAVPNNDEFWIEVDYLGSSGNPQSSVVKSSKSNVLSSAAAQSSDGSTWGGSTTPFKTSVTFTPQQRGMIRISPKIGKASTTLYYDPKVLVA